MPYFRRSPQAGQGLQSRWEPSPGLPLPRARPPLSGDAFSTSEKRRDPAAEPSKAATGPWAMPFSKGGLQGPRRAGRNGKAFSGWPRGQAAFCALPLARRPARARGSPGIRGCRWSRAGPSAALTFHVPGDGAEVHLLRAAAGAGGRAVAAAALLQRSFPCLLGGGD